MSDRSSLASRCKRVRWHCASGRSCGANGPNLGSDHFTSVRVPCQSVVRVQRFATSWGPIRLRPRLAYWGWEGCSPAFQIFGFLGVRLFGVRGGGPAWPRSLAASAGSIRIRNTKIRMHDPGQDRGRHAENPGLEVHNRNSGIVGTLLIDAELTARFMAFRPEAGRRLPSGNPRDFRRGQPSASNLRHAQAPFDALQGRREERDGLRVRRHRRQSPGSAGPAHQGLGATDQVPTRRR